MGSSAYSSGLDIDGESWLSPPCMGADQFVAGQANGQLTVAIAPADTDIAIGFPVAFVAQITGPLTASVWDFGDGMVVSNHPYASHAWALPGSYLVRLDGYNDSWPGGVSASVLVQVGAREVYYVDGSNARPGYPYTSWATGATNIQQAIDAGQQLGRLVLVADGVYRSGGRTLYGEMTSRVVVAEGVEVRSLNGPSATAIEGDGAAGTTNGGGAIRCVYLTSGATISGFTMTNGATRAWDFDWSADRRPSSGGGVFCESTSATVSNCIITGNSAFFGAGALGGTLNDCVISNNSCQFNGPGGGATLSVLNGCTIMFNSAVSGGGASLSMLNRCTLAGNSADGGGGVASSTVNDCILTNNSAASYGGGAYVCTLNGCTLAGNSAFVGGGAFGDSQSANVLNNCTVTNNRASYDAGGAASSTLNNCRVSGNSADFSGNGVVACRLNQCVVVSNAGPGTVNCALNGCVVSYNQGGGASGGTLTNCTLTFNSGWGASRAILYNSIVYFNTDPDAGNYDSTCTLNSCCTTPLPTNGVGNITADPELTDLAHVSAGSPCVGAGGAGYATGMDIDGETWSNPPSIGCDEYHPGAVGPLAVGLQATYTTVAPGFNLVFSGSIVGHAYSNHWDFGDGSSIGSEAFAPMVEHNWANAGEYLVTLTAYNQENPSGVSANVSVTVLNQVYVSSSSANPVPPYLSWATAATNIQDGVDAVGPGITVLVTNGIYATGGRALDGTTTSRVAVDKPITLRSVNGPGVTAIEGFQDPSFGNGIRCVYLSNGAQILGFTLTNGFSGDGGGIYCDPSAGAVSNCVVVGCWAGGPGGGAYGGTLNNCIVTGNFAVWGGGVSGGTLNNCRLSGNGAHVPLGAPGDGLPIGGSGGGAYGATLNGCTLDNNAAVRWGGGASSCILTECTLDSNSAAFGGGVESGTLNNCTIIRNSASLGGGAYGGALYNCTVVENVASDSGGGVTGSALADCILAYNGAWAEDNYTADSTLSYCCTTPRPTSGIGNITNAPLLVDLLAGNLRLQPDSPCINAGSNSYLTNSYFTNVFDLDGNPRIAGGTVDIGAYEFQNPTSLISYAWLQQYGLPIDGSADFSDSDGDGLNNWQEWRCGTDPTSAQSALRLLSALPSGTNVTVTWQSVAGVTYLLERSTNLVGSPSSFTPIATAIPGQPGTTSYADTGAVGPGPVFYRVGVGN
jgi:hypothetical protein